MLQIDSAIDRVAKSVANKRVTPRLPKGRTGRGSAPESTPSSNTRDDSSAWTAFIRYVDTSGNESERRFTCRKIEGTGEASYVIGFCHERRAVRTFIISNIREMVCCETGECFEAVPHFERLRQTGALPVEDKLLTDVVRTLIFLARCDGDYHPLERSSLIEGIERYCLRFDGTDHMINACVKDLDRIAPDGADLVRALNRIASASERSRVARFVLDSGAAIVDADGHHHPTELKWAVELSNSLKAIAAA